MRFDRTLNAPSRQPVETQTGIMGMAGEPLRWTVKLMLQLEPNLKNKGNDKVNEAGPKGISGDRFVHR